MLTQVELKELLIYEPTSGVFLWKNKRTGPKKSSNIAGYKNSHGYIQIRVKGKDYRAHQLAFLYMTGKFATRMIDHKNRTRDDNRWLNLREVTRSQNFHNSAHRNPKSGYKGVYWHKRNKKYCARIMVDKKSYHLGYFVTAEEASKAYKYASRRLVENII